VIGTTNRPGMIDSAIKRTGRFDDIIEVGLPNLEESKTLAKKYLKGVKIDADFDSVGEAIGEYGYSADWAGSEYDALKTKLVGKYIKNNKIPLTAQQITVTVSQIRRSLTRTKEEYLL
jgi:SpoVK/Ycf46/Vps4 family AAA+-type ATPase